VFGCCVADAAEGGSAVLVGDAMFPAFMRRMSFRASTDDIAKNRTNKLRVFRLKKDRAFDSAGLIRQYSFQLF
jgi:hypothetical protein